jgi:hypothetical protein
MRTWPLIYPEALTCPCIASILPERTPPWAYLSAFVLSKTLVLATINSPVHSRQNAEKREQKQLRRPSRFSHRNCASVRYCNKTRPALQRIPARFSIARSELHREQHPGTLTCQKEACILAVVPHVLSCISTTRRAECIQQASLLPARYMLATGMPI